MQQEVIYCGQSDTKIRDAQVQYKQVCWRSKLTRSPYSCYRQSIEYYNDQSYNCPQAHYWDENFHRLFLILSLDALVY